jgi:hypothetical protein
MYWIFGVTVTEGDRVKDGVLDVVRVKVGEREKDWLTLMVRDQDIDLEFEAVSLIEGVTLLVWLYDGDQLGVIEGVTPEGITDGVRVLLGVGEKLGVMLTVRLKDVLTDMDGGDLVTLGLTLTVRLFVPVCVLLADQLMLLEMEGLMLWLTLGDLVLLGVIV